MKIVYRKGIPHEIHPVKRDKIVLGYIEVPIIKSFAGLYRYMDRLGTIQDVKNFVFSILVHRNAQCRSKLY